MTGFGQGQATWSAGSVDVQVATVNHRHLQVNVRSDVRDVALEDALRKEARDYLQRGSVSMQVAVLQNSSDSIDHQALRALWQDLAGLAKELGAPPPSLESLLSQVPRRSAAVGEDLHGAVLDAAREALAACVAQRQREGEATGADLRERAASLRALHQELSARAPARLAPWREALLARVAEAVAQGISEEQLARECALQADRIDVSEELTRLQAHLDSLDGLLAPGTDAVGKPLEFLLQELGREVNTIGSKANDAALTQMVLAGKNTLEQIREQAANIL